MNNYGDSSYTDSRQRGYWEDVEHDAHNLDRCETALRSGESPQIPPGVAEGPIFPNGGAPYAPSPSSPHPRSYRRYSGQETVDAMSGRRFGAEPYDEVQQSHKRKDVPISWHLEDRGSLKRPAWDVPYDEVQQSHKRKDVPTSWHPEDRGSLKRPAWDVTLPYDEVQQSHKRKDVPSSWHPEDRGSSKHALAWDLPTHRSFCSAVYEIGLSHASPAVLMDRMELRDPAITSERIKSHLQKYRQNKNKSRLEFWTQYDRFVSLTATVTASNGSNITRSIVHSIFASSEHTPPPALPLLGGNAAAFLSVVVHAEATRPTGGQPQSEKPPPTPGAQPIPITLPQLTDTERESPLGESLVSAFGMFQSLCRHVMHQRAQAAAEDDDDSCSAYGGTDLVDPKMSGGAAQPPYHSKDPS